MYHSNKLTLLLLIVVVAFCTAENSKERPLRWGILAAGRISTDFVKALSILPKDEHTVVAIAARKQADADKFAKEHGIPKAYEGYEKLAEDPDVDVVYIGTINPYHLETAKMMMEKGKNVLCEKPLTMNYKQSKEMIETAKKYNVFLQEAIWSRSYPAYKALVEEINSGTIGNVTNVIVTLGLNMENDPRLQKKSLGGGSILDIGLYTLQFQQLIFKDEEPISIKSVGTINDDGVDDTMEAILEYSGGRTAYIQTSSLHSLTNEAIVIGNKGIIRIPTFWTPQELILPNTVKKFPLPRTNMTFNYKNDIGLNYEAQEVRRCIFAGLKQNPSITWAESLQIARLSDAIRKQVGVVYDVD